MSAAELEQGKCRSCGAPIVWIVMDSGKRMPLDAKPERLVVPEGFVLKGFVRECFRPHFATCPNADQHRRRPA